MATTDTTPRTFEVGRSYSTRRTSDHTQVLRWTVVSRSKCFAVLEDRWGEQVRVKLHDHGGEVRPEWAMPEGTYSMAPCITADTPDPEVVA